MEKIARFLKVSREQFSRDFAACGLAGDSGAAYQAVRLPARGTKGAAGYDFSCPLSLCLEPGQSVRIPTGIRVYIQPGWALFCFPRSGLGFRCRLQLDNTVGVIDSDYFEAENEGHILIQVTNDSRQGKKLALRPGDRFAQGVFLPYGLAETAEEPENRRGGLGSTGLGSGAF